MSDSLPEIPKQWISGLVPTMNDRGFMFEVLDEYADEFIRQAGSSKDESLEVGCAYGVATIAALAAGATITACDMDERHLQVLKSRVPEDSLDRLTLQQGTLPDIDLPENHFGNLLCSRVIHFMRGDDIDASVRNMYRWLKPGGRLFLIADTPYGIWRKFIPTWEANKTKGERWPGVMENVTEYLPYAADVNNNATDNSDDTEAADTDSYSGGLEFMNMQDPELLTRTCEEAGFVVERSSYIDRSDFGGKGRMDGRENCGLTAIKPN